MFKNYVVTAFRTLKRRILFSAINIIGLAIGLSACFLIGQYVRFESSYDTFHSKAGQLYRVPLQTTHHGVVMNEDAANVAALGPAMKSDLPEVLNYCRLVETSLFTENIGSYVANALEFSREGMDGKIVAFNEEVVWFADESFLSMFSFPLREGSLDALREPNSVVITERIAKKYFGSESPLGKELRLNRERVLKVTAVLENVPQNTHLRFDILISFSSMMPHIGDGSENWAWPVFYTYVELAPNTSADALQAKLPEFTARRLGENNEGEYRMRFFLQPITDIHLNSQMANELSPNSNKRLVGFLSLIAAFILIVAWINYINLSTAKALERSKEVGVRKTVGATRKQLIIQFFFDTIMVNCVALLLATIIVVASWPAFERLTGNNILEVLLQQDLMFDTSSLVIGGLILLLGTLIAGAYPALVLSSFNPAKVLKGKFYKSSSGVNLRKLMISFQYVLTMLLLAGTIMIYLQITYMRSQDPGFSKDQIIVLEAPAVFDSSAVNKVEVFKNAVMQIPGVINVTASSDIPGKKIVETPPIAAETVMDDDKYFSVSMPAVDTNFFSTYGIKLLEGRLFEPQELMAFRPRKDQDELIRLVVNEAFVSRLGIQDLKDALSVKLKFWWGSDLRRAEIVGIVADHHQLSFKDHVEPVAYMQPEWADWKYFSVNVKGDLATILAEVESAYSKVFPDNAVSRFFLDEFFDRQYKEDIRFGRIFNVFTVLAIVVTCMGLLGLSVFSATQRAKEVGVRKVLGASFWVILYLFSKDFVKLLIITYIIALPLIYWGSDQWLNNFTFRTSLGWELFILPPMLLTCITLTTVGITTIRAALESPVKALRQE